MKSFYNYLFYCILSIFFLSMAGSAEACSFKASFYGDTMVCGGSTVNYYTVPTPAHYYRWVVNGGTISSGAGTYSVYISWSNPGTFSIKLIDSISGCRDSMIRKIFVGVSAASLNSASYYLTGSYASVSGKTYTLTTNSGGNSSAWNPNKISLEKNFDFTFITNQSSTGSPADGMMFILQNNGTGVAGGGTGSDLGYYNASSPNFSQSVGIEEDIYLSGSGYNDSNATHLSLVKNDDPTPVRKQYNVSPNLYNGSDRKLRIVWLRGQNLFEVYFDGTKAFSWKNDLVKNIFSGKPNVWFGFTGATGGLFALQTFKNDSMAYGFPDIATPTDTICSGDTAVLTATAGLSYLWSSGATTRSIKVTKSGTFTVTVTDSFHCTQTSPPHSIVLISRPTASFTISNGCAGTNVSLTNGSTPTTGVNFLWKFGNGDSSTTYIPFYKYPAAGTYPVTLTVNKSGCKNKATGSITVYDVPSGINLNKSTPFMGQFNAGDAVTPDNICVGDTNVYQFTSPKGISNSDYGTKWQFSSFSFKTPFGTVNNDTAFKTPTSLKNATFRFTPSAKFADSMLILSIRVKRIPGNCDTLIQRYIQVRPKAVSKFGFTNACEKFPLSFADSSAVSGYTKVNNWAWDFGDGGTSNVQNPKHTYAGAGSYKVTLKATNDAGCGIAITKTVTQYPDPKSDTYIVPGCQAYSSVFTDTSSISTGSVASRIWYFGDGATDISKKASHSYAKSGYYNIRLVTTSNYGCKDSITSKIRILPKPTAQFNFNNSCVGTVIYFANTSFDSTSGTTYLWDFGDKKTSSAAAASHIYALNGTYTVKLTVTSKSGCFDTAVQIITPYPKPLVNFYHTSTCTGKNVTFSDSGKNVSNSVYKWDFGDAGTYVSKSITATHSYKKAGNYKVKLEIDAPSGCQDTESVNITVTDLPKPDFNATDVCLGKATIFKNTTNPNAGLTWLWSFGDGSTNPAQNPQHSYLKAGSFNVKLAATTAGGCEDTMTKKVNVIPIPVVGKWSANIHNYTVSFFPADTTQKSYKWFFGTGDSSSAKKPVYTYSTVVKKYQVKLMVTNSGGCSGTYTDSVDLTGTGIASVNGFITRVNVYPNPFEGETTIRFTMAQKAPVNISLFDLQGKLVSVVKEGYFEAGSYFEIIDAKALQLNEGVYVLKITGNGSVYTSRIVNLK